MTLVENLQSKNITVKPKRGKPPKAELKRLYPVVNEMFDEITQALNLGYTWSDVGAAVLERMEAAGMDVRFIKEWNVADIYKHIRRDRELRGFWTMNRSCFPMRYCEYRIGRSNSLINWCPVIVSRVWIGGRFYGGVVFFCCGGGRGGAYGAAFGA